MSREKNEKGQNRRSGLRIMGQMIGLVKPLLPIMLIAIFLGVIGYLCAIFLTIFAGYALIHEVLVLAGAAILPGSTDFLTTLAAGTDICMSCYYGGASGCAPLRRAVL